MVRMMDLTRLPGVPEGNGGLYQLSHRIDLFDAEPTSAVGEVGVRHSRDDDFSTHRHSGAYLS
jgi:hypothetical protein